MFATEVLFFALLGIVVNSTIAFTDAQLAEIKSKFLEAGKDCLTDHPLSAEDLLAFKDNKFPDVENAGCFAACVFKAVGLMDDQGQLTHSDALENVKKVVDDEAELKNIEEVISTCSAVNDENVSDGEKGCERAKLLHGCLTVNIDKFGFTD